MKGQTNMELPRGVYVKSSPRQTQEHTVATLITVSNESSLTYSKYIETAPVGIQYNACLEPFLIWVLADLVQWETVMQYDKPLALFKGLSEVSKTLWMKWTVPHRRACHEEFNKCKHPFKIPPWVLCECRHVNTWALQFIFLWQTLDQTI